MRHELHLTRVGLGALVAAVPVMLAAGAAVGGPAGTASVAVGVGLVAVNHGLAALSTGWSRELRPGAVAAGYAGFVVRMFGVFAAFAVASGLPWVHKGLLAGAFCAALIVTLTAECLSYVRGSYVPRWRMSR